MLLDKFVIHLKNVLFFKFTVYILAVIGLAILTPVLSNERDKAANKMNFAKFFLTQANSKLSSLKEFEEKIEETNTRYNSLAKNQTDGSCKNNTKVIQDLRDLLKSHKLITDAELSIKDQFERIFAHDIAKDLNHNTQNDNTALQIENRGISLKFKTRDLVSLKKVTDNVTLLLPNSAIIYEITLQEIKTLSPDLIKKLSKDHKFMKFDVKINVILREIKYSS